jgi:hypothetical protein
VDLIKIIKESQFGGECNTRGVNDKYIRHISGKSDREAMIYEEIK